MSQFIETLAPYAVKYGTAANVLPSLIIAQGVLESGSGTSSLAKNANNLFGIKKGSWTGETYAVVTGEYRKNDLGEDEYYEIVAEFRKYPSYEGAVIDLVEKYALGLKGESRNRYEAVLGQRDFALAAQSVKDAGYATDPEYPEKLIKIYNTYSLSKYDDVIDISDIIDIIEDKEETNMAFKIAVDAGHGLYTAGKRTPAGEREWTFNNMVVIALIAELKTYSNVEILRVDDPTGRTDVPLSTRAAKANNWGADLYISVHHNASKGVWGTWTGTETFVMEGSSSNSGSMKLANLVHPRLVSAMGLKNRGVKAANFAVLRETRMPAILTEGGYMDSVIDIVKMRNATVMKNQGKAIATGAALYFGAKKKSGGVIEVSNPNVDPMAKGYLMEGDTGTAVKVLQQGLNRLASEIGIAKIAEDGMFGPGTKDAVEAFQKHFKLEVDGYYGSASIAKMKTELAIPTVKPAAPINTSELYRVRRAWTDAASQLGAFSDLQGAIDVAKTKVGFNVYDGKGKQVYPSVVIAKPTPVEPLFRVRKSWTDADSQLGAFSELEGAKEVADKNLTHKVFDDSGKVVYDPKAEAERIAKEKAAKELAEANKQYNAEYQEAIDLGITDGSRPSDPATRKQVAVMIVRALKARK